MNKTLLAAKERLSAFGYDLMDGDEALLSLAACRYEQYVMDNCGISKSSSVPDVLVGAAADMAVGEFIKAKMAFRSECAGDNIIADFSNSKIVKQVAVGDTTTAFSCDDDFSPAACIDAFADYLISHGKGVIACYRKIRW